MLAARRAVGLRRGLSASSLLDEVAGLPVEHTVRGDWRKLSEAFPAYLAEYRRRFAPPPEAAHILGARFDTWLNRMGPAERKENQRFAAAAYTDLCQSTPTLCIESALQHALVTSVIASAMPPTVFLAHILAAQAFVTKQHIPDAAAAPDPHLMTGATAEQLQAQEVWLRSSFHGMYMANQTDYDNFLRQQVSNANLNLSKTTSAQGMSDADIQTARQDVQRFTRVCFPSEAKADRHGLGAMSMLGINCTYEDMADSIQDPQWSLVAISPRDQGLVEVRCLFETCCRLRLGR